MGPQKLADSLKITESQAKFLLQQYFETYEGVHEWFNTVETYAKRNGYVKTIIGRTRNLPDIWSRDRALYSRARRQAVNSVIQGSAADILKVAMVKIRQELKDRGLDATILSQIHDELVVQSLCSQSEEVAEVIKTYMEHPFSKELAVPLIVEPKIVKRWSDGK
jgi:DNA polymerase I